jgi:ubiquinone/menaquinone biosynthesis C-methylase UbiE
VPDIARKLRARERPPVPARADITGLEHPTQNPINALAHRQLNNALALAAREHAHGRLLDVGCGEKPYAPLFRGLVDEHVGVDHPESVHPLSQVDVLATAYEIPLADGSFDTVLMTEVLEHLEEPARGLAEAGRLLRPGGKLILTTPFMWPLHEEPRDFFRYSPYGLRHLLESGGFGAVTITPIAGKWTTMATFAGYTLAAYRVGPLRPPIDLFARVAQWVAVRLDELHFQPAMSWNHVVVATKA